MSQVTMRRIQVIDSHTGGEPTRVVVSGGPDLGRGPMSERVEIFRDRFDDFRSCVVNEPRGSDVVVGALLCEPVNPESAAGVIYFNNVGYIGMCGHGTIGLGATLAHMGRIGPGVHRVETPVGDVTMELDPDGTVAVENVVSRRALKDVEVDVPGLGRVTGDLAWGGNWFFLVQDHGERLDLANVERLTEVSWRIRQALEAQGVHTDDGREIDHVELFGPPSSPEVADSRNFVLCPGKAYDRSPCGTGTSAKLACLVADGKLAEGRVWRQESIVGSVFEGSARIIEGGVRPRIRGKAYITAESTLLVDPRDPFGSGIRT
ncbi:4-hydroxyproline epimerase [Paludisphaera mucosa]|uniref:4-hydroxyproline epimerase n=1 Tax=Paludisphaera mucosa TaxID=3030827 RepID=A0ABT6FFR0_9BACT|nr:4-hydroxyproline epimerase [Paludisphaera mucosa]MDG3006359.1 4-hydroxyproline epimerase [Paludisphaera mucosa]